MTSAGEERENLKDSISSQNASTLPYTYTPQREGSTANNNKRGEEKEEEEDLSSGRTKADRDDDTDEEEFSTPVTKSEVNELFSDGAAIPLRCSIRLDRGFHQDEATPSSPPDPSALQALQNVLFHNSASTDEEVRQYRENWGKVVRGTTSIIFFLIVSTVVYGLYGLISPYFYFIASAAVLSIVLHPKSRLHTSLDHGTCLRRMRQFSRGWWGKNCVTRMLGRWGSLLPFCSFVLMQWVFFLGLNKAEHWVQVEEKQNEAEKEGKRRLSVARKVRQGGRAASVAFHPLPRRREPSPMTRTRGHGARRERQRFVSTKGGRHLLRGLTLLLLALLGHYSVGSGWFWSVHLCVVLPLLVIVRSCTTEKTFLTYTSRLWRSVVFLLILAGLLVQCTQELSLLTYAIDYAGKFGEKEKKGLLNEMNNFIVSKGIPLQFLDFTFLDKGQKEEKQTWERLTGFVQSSFQHAVTSVKSTLFSFGHPSGQSPSRKKGNRYNAYISHLVVPAVLQFNNTMYGALLFIVILRYLISLEHTVLYYLLSKLLSVIQPTVGERHARLVETDITTSFTTLLLSFWHMVWYHFTLTYIAFSMADIAFPFLAGVLAVLLTLFPVLPKVANPLTLAVVISFMQKGQHVSREWASNAEVSLLNPEEGLKMAKSLMLLLGCYLDYNDEWLLCVYRGFQGTYVSDAIGFEKEVFQPFVVTTAIVLGFVRFGMQGIVVGPLIIIVAKVLYDNWDLVLFPEKEHHHNVADAARKKEGESRKKGMEKGEKTASSST